MDAVDVVTTTTAGTGTGIMAVMQVKVVRVWVGLLPGGLLVGGLGQQHVRRRVEVAVSRSRHGARDSSRGANRASSGRTGQDKDWQGRFERAGDTESRAREASQAGRGCWEKAREQGLYDPVRRELLSTWQSAHLCPSSPYFFSSGRRCRLVVLSKLCVHASCKMQVDVVEETKLGQHQSRTSQE